MLKLLIFVPCEKLIIGEKGQPSLIGVIEMITITPEPNLPGDALIPFKWSFLTQWTKDEELADQTIDCEIEVRLIRPDKSEAMRVLIPFAITSQHANYRQHGEINAFPVGQDGIYNLDLFLRKRDEEWRKIASYPIIVKHLQPDTKS